MDGGDRRCMEVIDDGAGAAFHKRRSRVGDRGLHWFRAALRRVSVGPPIRRALVAGGLVCELHGHIGAAVVLAPVEGAACAGERPGAAGDGERRLATALDGDLAQWQDDRAGALETAGGSR